MKIEFDTERERAVTVNATQKALRESVEAELSKHHLAGRLLKQATLSQAEWDAFAAINALRSVSGGHVISANLTAKDDKGNTHINVRVVPTVGPSA